MVGLDDTIVVGEGGWVGFSVICCCCCCSGVAICSGVMSVLLDGVDVDVDSDVGTSAPGENTGVSRLELSGAVAPPLSSSSMDLKYSPISTIASSSGLSVVRKFNLSSVFPLLKPSCPRVLCRSVNDDNSLPTTWTTGD